jgi:hypothetical protein
MSRGSQDCRSHELKIGLEKHPGSFSLLLSIGVTGIEHLLSRTSSLEVKAIVIVQCQLCTRFVRPLRTQHPKQKKSVCLACLYLWQHTLKLLTFWYTSDITNATYASCVEYSSFHPLPLPKLTSSSQEIRLPQRHTLHATDRVCRCAMKVEVRYHILPQIH